MPRIQEMSVKEHTVQHLPLPRSQDEYREAQWATTWIGMAGISLNMFVIIVMVVIFIVAHRGWRALTKAFDADLAAKWERVRQLGVTRLRLAKRVKALPKRPHPRGDHG